MRIILLSMLLISCSVFGTKKKKEYRIPTDDLILQKHKIIDQMEISWPGGWIGRDCDGLLWNALAGLSGAKIDLLLAEYEMGKWHRRPKPACWQPGRDKNESGSTISNDMLTGLMMYLAVMNECFTAERLYEYGKKNEWVMGEPYPEQIARVVLRPNGRYLLARIIKKNCDKTLPDLVLPNVYLPVTKDYEYHLQTIGILMTADLNGVITKQMHNRLRENAVKFPKDALFNAALGWFDQGALETALLQILDPAYKQPSYVRGHEHYKYVHKLFVTWVLLDGADKSKLRLVSE